jgi:hypothetical protein
MAEEGQVFEAPDGNTLRLVRITDFDVPAAGGAGSTSPSSPSCSSRGASAAR